MALSCECHILSYPAWRQLEIEITAENNSMNFFVKFSFWHEVSAHTDWGYPLQVSAEFEVTVFKNKHEIMTVLTKIQCVYTSRFILKTIKDNVKNRVFKTKTVLG